MTSIVQPNLQESSRVKILHKYKILDTLPDASFDHITKLAAHLFHVPVALVSFVDTDLIWFKSVVGALNLHQIDRVPGFCASAILSDDVYVVEDAFNDPRTLGNPLLASSFDVRFYAAAPLKVREGFSLGALCIIDSRPRNLTDFEKRTLLQLSEILIDQFEVGLEARKINAHLNLLLSLMAHELKNSLSTIPVYAQLIRDKINAENAISQMATRIMRASNRMRTQINDMLELAQLQTTEVKLTKEKIDISFIIGQATATNTVLANLKNQNIILDIEDRIVINADESKIAEIADNLINNAIKYSSIGAEIKVKLSRLDERVVLEVTDEGPGLSESDMEKIFTPFTRLSAKPTGGENATGAGLSIVKLLVNAHGGIVTAGNNPIKKGAIFKVEIPVNPDL